MADPLQEVYVGPRPFERSERDLFFGRDREISELLSLVVSSRVVLCYAPSGAGKTSLMNAGLQPRLEQEGFEVLPSTRVRGVIPEGIDHEKVTNIYIFNALLSLAGNEGALAGLAGRSLAEYLLTRPHLTDEEGFPAPRILIFDQFEELLTSYPERWQERDGFFQQVREAFQADSLLRVVFIMREDFLARIEPYMRLLKPHQQARFRLALLGQEGAHAAVTGPLRGTGRHFKAGVVADLIEELLKVRVETAQGEAIEVVGENVEPVQLQVVCRNLWTSLPPDVQEISPEHLKAYGDVDQALRDFYESCLAQAKAGLGANELNMRQWFEQQLITPAGTRGIVFRDAQRTADLPNPVVDFLENRHLIRGEWRAGSRWYELTHDRFIEPIQRANELWRSKRQARRNRWLMAAGGTLLLVMVLLASMFSQRPVSQSSGVSTAVAATIVVESTNARATAQVQAQVAQEDVTLSKSRQLAAEALLEDDQDLSLLLAVEANQSADTLEARKSLHKILSRRAVIGGNFLREFNPEIISPGIVKRLEDHKQYVYSVAFSPDGRRFVSGGEGATLIRWDMSTGEPVGLPLTGHRGNVLNVAFSPDGTLIASAGSDAQIRLWDASTGKLLGNPLMGHESLVTSLAFSPDGKRLASGDNLGKLRIWDLSTGEFREASQPAEVWSVAWSPDGSMLAAGSAGHWARLFDTEKLDLKLVLKGHNGLVRALAWSPDGRSLASGSVVGNDQFGEVILWDVASGEIIAQPLQNRLWPVRTVAFHPNGAILAIGQDNDTITFWDTRSGQILGNPLKAHNHRVMSIAFSPDGRYMLSGSIDTTVALWDLFAPTRSIAISADSNVLATSQGTAISLWDLSAESTTPVNILSGHTEDVLALAFSPDGSSLASAGRDDTILLWDVGTGEKLLLLEPQAQTQSTQSGDVLTLAFSPDGSTLISGSENGQVLLWELGLDKYNVQVLLQHNGPVSKLRVDDDGKSLEVLGRDGVLTTLDMVSGLTQVQALPIGRAGVGLASIAFSKNGEAIAFFQDAGITLPEGDGRAHGIELSILDDSFDPTVNPDDLDFIVVKTTDGFQIDGRFEEFLGPVQAIPIRGALHFFRADQPWKQQADLFLSTVKDQGFHFFILDLEVNPEGDSTTFLSDAEQWLKYVRERVAGQVFLQVGNSYLTSFGPAGDWMKTWPLLIMQYSFEPDRNGTPFLPQGFVEWKIWQYTDKGNGAEYGVGGTSAYLEVYNGTPRDMWEWLDITSFAIYDHLSGELIHPKQEMRVTGLNGIAFSPDGTYLAVAQNGMVSLLNPESGEAITTLNLGGRTLLSLAFTDVNRLAIGMEDGSVLLWDLGLLDTSTNLEPYLQTACEQAKRNFTDSEWARYFPNEPYRIACPNLPAP